MGIHRSSLESAAQAWLEWLSEVDRLAIVDVSLDGPEAVADLLGFAVEPALKRGIELVIGANHALEDLDEAIFLEPDFGYAYSLERLRWRLHVRRPPRARPAQLPDTGFVPDVTQKLAVEADDGVVQIIAPAGSGKTTVLVERVRELRRRGVSAERIVCVTFNKAAAEELKERLARAGVGDVRATTFHGLGYGVLRRAGRLPRDVKVKGPTLSQWRMLAATAKKEAGEDGVWLDPAQAKGELSNIKLGLLMTAEEYAASINEGSDERARTMALLYKAHDKLQREQGQIEFDDMILRAVLLLREDAHVRGVWQESVHRLLVDEYQDIEPAQELLVRMIAAPHDELFCVGDEDQTLYAFRRASVERIICLDELYPGLQRVALGINYRCPQNIVEVSRALIAVNQKRFPKRIEADTDHPSQGTITLRGADKTTQTASEVAQELETKTRGEVVVLARTTNALRPVALACADRRVPIDGTDRLFEPTGARRALADHLRLALDPQQASEKLVRRVCQTPGRGLRGATQVVAAELQAGEPFSSAFRGVEAPRRGGGKLLAPGELFTRLAACNDGAAAIVLLRGPGGFDAWFEDEDNLGGLDQFECEVLEQAERDAKKLTPREYLELLERQARALQAIRDKQNGIELSTIHGAKGRQWPQVIVVACEEGALPHPRSLEVSAEEVAHGEGIEAERRLGYVAFTRAQKHLQLHFDKDRPSRFLTEAGLIAAPSRPARPPRVPPPVPQPPGMRDPSARNLAKLLRRGRLR
jgi:superfamily I DNA/RNA helicase